jgi:hypothetical protein
MTRNTPAPHVGADGAPTAPNGDFYVGYLKVPPRLGGFLRWCVPSAIVAVLTLAWYVSRSQNNPGSGVWHADAQTLVGRIAATPYPMVRVLSGKPGSPIETVLLVSEGKHGGGERVAALDGRIARVRGSILERDGRRLLELADGEAVTPDDSLPAVDAARLAEPGASPTGASLGRVILRGEIIDPKCYLGAMKPGGGKTHKACAMLCISGGIPPMLVTRDAANNETFYLLATEDGRAANERVLDFVGDSVEVSGRLERHGDLLLLRVAADGMRRR